MATFSDLAVEVLTVPLRRWGFSVMSTEPDRVKFSSSRLALLMLTRERGTDIIGLSLRRAPGEELYTDLEIAGVDGWDIPVLSPHTALQTQHALTWYCEQFFPRYSRLLEGDAAAFSTLATRVAAMNRRLTDRYRL